ncbi:MAG: quinolinate synthase NadA [Phycisphaerales bacterium]|jgi:quinolinate synthase|nr:quinolinate synthase NadA [Phycisphaerales bacterium]
MLWQPALPDEYIQASPADLRDRITARRKQLGSKLIILGHHYQTDEVIQHADFTGDSLKLSQLAAQQVAASGAKYVIFCGVHFMAESADMLTPPGTAVILPDMSAGCSMADMADYDEAVQAWDLLHASLTKQGFKGRVIPITYINSTAAIKAFVGQRHGAVCTSSNARFVLEWALRGGDTPLAKGEKVKVLFLPDQHLGRNTAAKLGLDVTTHTALYDPRQTAKGAPLGGMTPKALLDATVILWAGHCSVHKLFKPEHIHAIRDAEKHLPKAQQTRVLVHPECAKEVVDLADLDGSTEFIIKTLQSAERGSRWAIGTEVHLVARLAAAVAKQGVTASILSDCQCLCTTMYRIDQPHLLWVLDNLAKGKVVNQVTVNPQAQQLALLALDRMLKLSLPIEKLTKPATSPDPTESPVAIGQQD